MKNQVFILRTIEDNVSSGRAGHENPVRFFGFFCSDGEKHCFSSNSFDFARERIYITRKFVPVEEYALFPR